MRLKFVAASLAVIGTLAVMAAPADAQSSQRRATTDSRGHTVFTSRDENGRTRTKIIIQKRSYLDPGTEVLPGTSHDNNYAVFSSGRATDVLDNTTGGSNQTALPRPGELGFGKNGPFLQF